MKPSTRAPIIVGILAAVVAALSACADIERIGHPGTPYTMPAQPHDSVLWTSSASSTSAESSSALSSYLSDRQHALDQRTPVSGAK